MESATIEVGAREFRELRGAERDAALMVVARTARWCLAEMGRMVGEVIENGSFEEDGHANPRAWLQAVLNCSRQDAGALVSTARMLRELATSSCAPATAPPLART